MSYADDAKHDAISTVEYFVDEIIEKIIDDGEASDDLHNDYGNGDAYHHESHVDKHYDLTEAAECLDELREHEETDSGLWQGLPPREAIGAQAAYTYGNAVLSYWRDLIKEINEACEGALSERADEIDGWSVEMCLEYIAANGIDYDAPEEFDDDAITEVRAMAAEHPDRATIEKAVNATCEGF